MKQATVAGITADGVSVKEAKEKASKAIETFVKVTTGGPRVLALGNLIGIVFVEILESNSQLCYQYMIVDPENIQTWSNHSVQAAISSGHTSMNDAERHMRLHAAQRLFNYENDDPSGVLQTTINTLADMEDHARWCKWQRRYRELSQQGLPDHDIRETIRTEGL